MPLNSTRGAGSAKGFGFTAGAKIVDVDYLVIAGGGAGVPFGAGGAGGYRTSFPGGTKLSLKAGSYTVVVGAGGAAPSPQVDSTPHPGSPSSFSTITSAGGGSISTGGSGAGGQIGATTGYAGNTPPVSPPQGNPGGDGTSHQPGLYGGGGGGAGAAGDPGTPGGAGAGGAGLANSISGSSVTRGGGGGGSGWQNQPGASGGSGGGGNAPCGSGTVNTGGGGGGGGSTGCSANNARQSGAGGSGIVIIRAPSTVNFSVSPGTNTVTTLPAPAGGCKVATFTVSGSNTITIS
jgi:hypothetical protein